MRGRLLRMILATLVTLTGADAFASQLSGGVVEVSGAGSKGMGAGYSLSLSYTIDSDAPPGEAVLVYAEPSHILLVQHSFRDRGLGETGFSEALAHGRGNTRSFSYDLLLPYNPRVLGDSAISVVLRSQGRDWLVAAGKVDTRAFNFTTRFEVIHDAEGAIVTTAGAQHCCGGGGRCGQMCVTCDGAFFTCDRINCTIDCGWL